MTHGATFLSLAVVLGKGGDLVRDLGRWWLREFLGLVPQRLASWLVDDGSRSLVLAADQDAVVLRLVNDGRRDLASIRVPRRDYGSDAIDSFLHRHRQSRTRVSVGLELPPELIFRRSFALPIETRRALDAVVVQDLLAKTPFQRGDIHHAHRVRRVGDKLAVSQCVVRDAHVVAAAEALGLAPGDIAFVEVAGTEVDAEFPSIIAVGSSPVRHNPWVARLVSGLAVTALLLAVTALGAKYHRQQVELDGLQAEVVAATAKARNVLGIIDKIQQEQALLARLRDKRSGPGLLDIWEEATRLLPTHTWVSELRLSETQERSHVVMMGFSASAAGLVALLDQSQVFSEAALVGPISVDPTEGKERFIIQTKLKPHPSSRTASR